MFKIVIADTTEITTHNITPNKIGRTPTCFKLAHDNPEPIKNKV